MRHLKKGRKLGRSPEHRRALMRNMACQLFTHERISTTQAKAKELRPYAEKLITIARRGSAAIDAAESAKDEEQKSLQSKALHSRRLLIQRLGGKKFITVGDEDINVIDKLLKDIGPRFQSRPGGYTRIIKRNARRLGDAAFTAYIELVGSETASPEADSDSADNDSSETEASTEE